MDGRYYDIIIDTIVNSWQWDLFKGL